jgi:hypothetical protein
MAATVDAPSIEPAMPGSAQLPADLARPARRRKRKGPPRAGTVSKLVLSRVARIRSMRGPSIPRLVRAAILATLAAGVTFAALAGHEPPRPNAPKTRASASSESPGLAALQTAFAAIQRQANTSAIAEHKAPDQRTVRQAPASRHHPKLQRSRRGESGGTHLTLTADHTSAPNPQTTTTETGETGEEIASNGTAGQQQRQQPSSHAAASNQPASPPAGPSGLGQVVGTNCDPKCK